MRQKLFPNLRLPLMAAPMFLVSGPDLVVAACKAGIIGTFPTPNARTPEILEDWLQDITGRLEGDAAAAPWAANLVVHRSNTRLGDDLALVKKYRAPLVITALGSPRDIVSEVHAYGGRVFADVNSVPFARKAAAAGVDGLVLVASGAGGHTGQMTGFSFVPAVREFFDGPIVLGGGITTGGGIAAAEMLGADFAYMGTRFIAAEESLASPDYKQMLTEVSAEDLVPTRAVTGVLANWLRPTLERAGYDVAMLEEKPNIDFTDPQSDAKRWANVWSAGHGVGAIKQVEPVRAIVDRLKAEYDAARQT